MIQHPDGSMQQFDNRMRILMNLDDEAFPPALREDNPHSAALWAEGMAGRLLAFIRAPDAVRQAIWQAVLDYEGKDASVAGEIDRLKRQRDRLLEAVKAWEAAWDVPAISVPQFETASELARAAIAECEEEQDG